MAFNWQDYIQFSEELITNRNDEASMRSAISRAYYGAFGSIKSYCISEFSISSKENKGPEIHQKIIERLKTSKNKLEFSTGNFLSNLRDDRNKADYDSTPTPAISKPLAFKALSNSKAVISNLKQLSTKAK